MISIISQLSLSYRLVKISIPFLSFILYNIWLKVVSPFSLQNMIIFYRDSTQLKVADYPINSSLYKNSKIHSIIPNSKKTVKQ